jgi:hypothetical protein
MWVCFLATTKRVIMSNTSQMIKRVTTLSTITLGLLFSGSISAASISTFRIYLDREQSTDNFLIFSKSDVTENCNLRIRHYNFDKTGQMTEHKEEELPDNSAKEWIRYTPRSFELPPMGQQTVRFSLRRKASSTPMEYRSYVSIECDKIEQQAPLNSAGNLSNAESNNDSTATVGITPRLVQNVPIVVRNGKLDASLTFSDIKYNNGKLTFNLNRTGDRSVYGRLSLINNQSGDEINYTGGISLYTETAYSNFEFNTDLPLSDLSLKFVENERYGGSIELLQDVNL